MDFEYDPAKSDANAAKHGINFDEAQALWYDERLLTVEARVDDEVRFMAVGRIGDRIWSAIYTVRGVRVRIISVRRARQNEVEYYESQ